MAGSWGCPHEVNDLCGKVANRPCDPGMKGCVLAGRYVFVSDDKNLRFRQKLARNLADDPPPEPDAPGATEESP